MGVGVGIGGGAGGTRPGRPDAAPSPPAGAEHCSGRPNPRGPGHLLCGSLSALGLSFPSLSWREAGCWYLPEVEPHLARLHFPFLWRRDPPPQMGGKQRQLPRSQSGGRGIQSPGVLSLRLPALGSLSLAKGSGFPTLCSPDPYRGVRQTGPLPLLPGHSDAVRSHRTDLGNPYSLTERTFEPRFPHL